jgi:hypothetical protein
LLQNKEIYLIDHELAFSFLYDIFPSSMPWQLTTTEAFTATNHVFYNFLKGKSYNFTDFLEKLLIFGPTFWQAVRNQLPQSWQTETTLSYIAIIEKRFLLLQQHRTELETELNTLLQ